MQIKTAFKNRLLQEASEFDDIRLVFDQYLNCSLKEQYCEKRTSGRQIKYLIRDSAPLKGITLKYFLSHIETKSDLTTYLAECCVKELEKTKSLLLFIKHLVWPILKTIPQILNIITMRRQTP